MESGLRHHQSNASLVLDHEDFTAYVNYKMLDSIGYPGAYRKFLLKRKVPPPCRAIVVCHDTFACRRSRAPSGRCR